MRLVSNSRSTSRPSAPPPKTHSRHCTDFSKRTEPTQPRPKARDKARPGATQTRQSAPPSSQRGPNPSPHKHLHQPSPRATSEQAQRLMFYVFMFFTPLTPDPPSHSRSAPPP